MLIIKSDEDNFLCKFCETLQTILDELQTEAQITIGLSGGSLIQQFCSIFDDLKCDWRRVTFFLADERKVPVDDVDSTFGQYSTFLISKFPSKLNLKQFIIINPHLPVEECASDYEHQLRHCTSITKTIDGNWPRFDLLLLGIGPDGHTCSLFPGHPALKNATSWVLPIRDSPKPPPERVTLTLAAVNDAKNILFVAKGSSKASIIKEIITDGSQLPAALVKPVDGKLYWLIDEAAASQI